MSTPETIDGVYITQLLRECFPGMTKTSASTTASDLLLRLPKVPGVVLICKRCREVRGKCHCKDNGYPIGGSWRYLRVSKPWCCSVPSLLNVPDSELKKHLGPKAYSRVVALIQRLRQKR